MSGVGFFMTTPEVGLASTVLKTAIEITAAANHRVLIESIGYTFDGVEVTDAAVVCSLIRIGTTGTGSNGTPVLRDSSMSETLQVDFKYNFTVEPTGKVVLKSWNIHPQSGFEYFLPITSLLPIPGGTLIGVQFTAPVGVNVIVSIEGTE